MKLFLKPSSSKSNRFETAIWAAKLVLMSMGMISTLILLKVAIIPCTFDLVLTTFPRLWVSARSWLSPLFVYIIVNFIIITIAVSSNLHHHKNVNFFDSLPTDLNHTATTAPIIDHAVPDTTSHQSKPENQSNEPKKEKEVEEEGELKDYGLSCNKTITDPSPDKCANDYLWPDSGDKGDDTLEATWRAIMEGQGKSVTPQLKKSDTWTARITKAEPLHENEDGDDDDNPVAWAQKELRKSETFNDTASLRREKSMSPEELKLRTETFIQKFKNQMKLQRLESYQRFMEMVNRGVKCD